MSGYDLWKERQADGYHEGRACESCPSDDAFYDWHGRRWICGDCSDDEERLAATDPDAPYDERDLREWSEEAQPTA